MVIETNGVSLHPSAWRCARTSDRLVVRRTRRDRRAVDTFYWRQSHSDGRFGRRPLAIACVLNLLHVFNSPWFSQF